MRFGWGDGDPHETTKICLPNIRPWDMAHLPSYERMMIQLFPPQPWKKRATHANKPFNREMAGLWCSEYVDWAFSKT